MPLLIEPLPQGVVGHPRQIVFCEWCEREIGPDEWAEYLSARVGQFAFHATGCEPRPPALAPRSPEGFEAAVEARVAVRQAVRALPYRERVLLALRYGLDGGDPLTLDEIGSRFCVTRERVRQLQQQAQKRLRWLLEGDVLPPPRRRERIPVELIVETEPPLPGCDIEVQIPDWLAALAA